MLRTRTSTRFPLTSLYRVPYSVSVIYEYVSTQTDALSLLTSLFVTSLVTRVSLVAFMLEVCYIILIRVFNRSHDQTANELPEEDVHKLRMGGE